MTESEPTSEADDDLTPVEIERDDSPLARRVVRPPRVWIGIGTVIVGMIVIGVALVSPAQWIAFIGVVLVIAGGFLAWWNGVLADAHGGGMTETVENGLSNDARAGTLPGDRLHDERAVTDAASAEASVAGDKSSERVARPASPFEQGRAASVVLAIGAAWLVLTLPAFDLEPANRDPALRQGAMAIVLSIAAIRMVVVGPTMKWAAAAATASALLLISLAVWWPEFDGARVAGLVGPGIAGLVGGMVSLGAAASVIVALNPRRTTS